MSDCLFCKIAAGEIPSAKVYEDEEILAFRDIAPKAPVHILLIPKKHLASLAEAGPDDAALLGKMQLLARQLAEKEGVAESGFRVLTNSGPNSGQEVAHVLPAKLIAQNRRLVGRFWGKPFCEKTAFCS